jgi:hypothetical protein
MRHRALVFSALLAIAGLSSTACGDPTSAGGTGDVVFTTWGEEYIEEEIPAGDYGGFVDGWSLAYSKFLVVIGNITLAGAPGESARTFARSVVFNHTGAGVKRVAAFDSLPAKHWEQASYEIGPAEASTEKDDSVNDDDLTYMVDNGYSLHLVADATKDGATKHIDWSFDLATRYVECNSDQNGKPESGVVVTNNGRADVQLTIHGDHPFYDRLQASSTPGVETSLRFDAVAAADKNDDDEVTLEELDNARFDVLLYDPSGIPGVTTLGSFVRALIRTVGHYRGEGECEIESL